MLKLPNVLSSCDHSRCTHLPLEGYVPQACIRACKVAALVDLP